jgi:hypothetical protein
MLYALLTCECALSVARMRPAIEAHRGLRLVCVPLCIGELVVSTVCAALTEETSIQASIVVDAAVFTRRAAQFWKRGMFFIWGGASLLITMVAYDIASLVVARTVKQSKITV